MSEQQRIHIFRVSHPKGREFNSPLSLWGKTQAREIFQKHGYYFTKPTLIVTSTQARYLETALYAFHPDFNPDLKAAINEPGYQGALTAFKDIKILVDPRVQEVERVYDDGGAVPTRAQINPNYRKYLTFSEEFFTQPALDEEVSEEKRAEMEKTDESRDWHKGTGLFAGWYGHPMILERGASLKEFLYNRPEREIIILSGNDFIDTLLRGPHFKLGEGRLCFWIRTFSGRKRLLQSKFSPVPHNWFDSQVVDDDYSDFWGTHKWRSIDRSVLYHKWYTVPHKAVDDDGKEIEFTDQEEEEEKEHQFMRSI